MADSEKIIGLGILAVLFLEYGGSLFSPVGTSTVPVIAPGSSGLTPNQISQLAPTTITTPPSVAVANQQINQQILTQNTELSIAGTAATAVVGSLASAGVLAASVAGPIGIAIGAIVLLVKSFVTDAHLYANQLVQKYQNPFGNYLISVVNAVSDALNARTLTLTEVNAAYQGVSTAWQNFESVLHQLQSQSSDWYIVATQALNFFDNQYMGVTLPNGKVLGVGGDGQYGNTPNQGMMTSWLNWFQQLQTDPQVIPS